jgi:hypothetical protein
MQQDTYGNGEKSEKMQSKQEIMLLGATECDTGVAGCLSANHPV